MRELPWTLILALGALGLARPLLRMTGVLEAPLLLTLLITVVWVLVVGLSRTPRPVLTLVLAAVVYAALSTLLSAVLSVVLLGQLHGPLAMPAALPMVLVTNLVWGSTAGLLALGVRRLKTARPGAAQQGAVRSRPT